jgi:hypothetical protein
MTRPGPDNGINFIAMKPPISYIGGSVIVAIMFLAVFVGGANACDCTRGQSVATSAANSHH